jgi:lysophospholipase L1-like esterase
MKFAKGDKLVLIGDSITDAGRGRPVGEGLFDAIGKGYVSLIDALLNSVYPRLGVRVVNMGSSGNTVRELKARWQTDVLDLKPDWLSIMIGTNDVWRQFDSPRQREWHVYPDEYESIYRELIETTRPRLKGLVLMTPFYIEPNKADAMRAQMDRYGAITKKLAGEFDAIFVDTQAAFEPVLEPIYPATIAWDRVHPNHIGNAVLARAFLNAVGFEWK